MKKLLLACTLLASVTMMSCEKENSGTENTDVGLGNVEIRYDFTATTPAEYFFVFTRGTEVTDDSIVTQNYSRTFTAIRRSAPSVAQFEVFPPEDWMNTTESATVNLKISVNGTVMKDTTGILAGVDRPTGISVTTTY